MRPEGLYGPMGAEAYLFHSKDFDDYFYLLPEDMQAQNPAPQQPFGAPPQAPQPPYPYGAPQQPYGVPQPPYAAPAPMVVDPNMQKSKMAAGLLGIFLGSFGVHNFYLGYTGKAVAQLLITVLTCGFGSFVSGIWGLVEGIMILSGNINVDGKNIPLKD